MKKMILLLVLLWTAFNSLQAQNITQRVRGQIIDAASKQPLAGVVIFLINNNQLNATTDADGFFVISNVPVGRQSFHVVMNGFEPQTISEVMVIAGKELELNVALKENLHQLEEVTVSAGKDRVRPLNEFATLSARSFSVEETRRYAASFADPARMVMNFPGVSNGGDFNNGIVVRGNSPKGVLWRLEGIEIPNPNHFGSLGNTGGAISMLNANVLGTSDFYTGAFPAEFGNALSGAFDLNFRNGNTEQREHSFQVGALGIEAATEGPFGKNSKASYLVNYRYSTLALLGRFLDLDGVQPNYQDASFKLNFPTKKAGTFSVFGLGGYNSVFREAEKDSSKWDDENNFNSSFKGDNMMGVAGVTHQYFLNRNTYIRTILSASYDRSKEDADTLNPADNYNKVPVSHTSFSNTAYRFSVMYNQKFDAKNTLRAGVIAQQMGYDMNFNYYDKTERQWKNILKGDGSAQYYQGYVQWKSRLTENLTATGGLHGSYFALNGSSSIEPRLGITYDWRRQQFSLAAGLHSKPEHISTYLYDDVEQGTNSNHPNKNLDLSRAFHLVGGYSTQLPFRLRLKTEVYYQHLYSIPVEQDSSGAFSMINAEDVFSLLGTHHRLVSNGTGNNYGVDISLERPFTDGYYLIMTGSIYHSTYKAYSGKEYNTRYDRGYQLNVIGGKEFKLNTSGRRLLGLNGKILYSGGLRESLIDLNASRASGETEIVPGEYFTQKGPAYFRADISAYYKFNTKKSTHTILLEIQNVTNHENYYASVFDSDKGQIKRYNQMGFFPNISYRIDFKW